MHFYAALIQLSLFFCLLGDIGLMFYIPSIPLYDNPVLIILSGTSFFIARVLMTLAFLIYPFRGFNEKIIPVSFKKAVLVSIIPFIYFVWSLVYFIINMKPGTIKIILPIYYLIMSINLFTSLLRIKSFEEETLKSQILGAVGTILFTVSDSLLFWVLFIDSVKYGDVISILFYWSGMYLISLSVVRTSSPVKEISVNKYIYTIN